VAVVSEATTDAISAFSVDGFCRTSIASRGTALRSRIANARFVGESQGTPRPRSEISGSTCHKGKRSATDSA